METKLTDNQKTAILTRSKQAQAFLTSDLYREWEKWLKQEQDLTAAAMALNTRAESEKSLTRAEFLERKSAYWIVLPTALAVFKQWAEQEEALAQIEEHEKTKGH